MLREPGLWSRWLRARWLREKWLRRSRRWGCWWNWEGCCIGPLEVSPHTVSFVYSIFWKGSLTYVIGAKTFLGVATECRRRQPTVALFGSSGEHGFTSGCGILFWLRRSGLIRFCNQLNQATISRQKSKLTSHATKISLCHVHVSHLNVGNFLYAQCGNNHHHVNVYSPFWPKSSFSFWKFSS